jgi:peptidoglycan/LPS O-acetylase OafA/YrhL
LAAWVPLAIAAGALFGLYATFRHGTSILGSMGWIVFPLLIAAAFAAVVSWPSPWLSRLVASAPFAGLGRISYSAYLYHLPVLILFNAFLPGTGAFVSFLVWLVAVAGIAAGSYRFVEVPYLARPQRMTRQPAVPQ